MAQVIKRENITIVIGQYTDNNGQDKKKYKTIGELVTMQGDDGQPYQFGELWGAHGVTKFNVYEQQDKNAAYTNQPPAQQGYPQHPPQQGGYANPQAQSNKGFNGYQGGPQNYQP